VLITCGILAALLGSYYALVRSQLLMVARAGAWDNALVVAEAGVEEAMAHLNQVVDTNNLAINSWVNAGGGIYCKTNYLDESYWIVKIKLSPAVTNVYPVIVSTGYVPGPNGGSKLARTVQVTTKAKMGTGAGGAILVADTLTFGGFNVTVDSFDSSDPNHSTGGLYDFNKRLDHGDILTTSSVSNAIDVGNSKVYGAVHTAPGGVVGHDTSNHPGYSVGDSNWVSTATVGFEPGYIMQDVTTTITDVTLPSLSWLPAVGGAKYKLNGVMYDYKIQTSGPLKIDGDLTSSVYVSAPNVVLYVTGNVNLGTGMAIYIAPGASLAMYVAGADTNIGGQGVLNSTGLARNFEYYGLPTNTSFSLKANASFTGQIDAPEAYVTIGGGGSSPFDFSGQIVANSMKMNGHFNVHYDQNLSGGQKLAGYQGNSWDEL
jgi:hypothetical protein